MQKYENRKDAGEVLAAELQSYANRKDVIVLALPRGGVPVAFEIAKSLHVPLDIFLVRKLGVPGQSELAMGAIAMGNTRIFNQEIIDDLKISKEKIERVIAKEQQELKRRETAYRGQYTFPILKDKTVILVDDGIATGATMRAAITALRQLKPASIIAAVPVAEKTMCEKMQPLVESLICPMRLVDFRAVGEWYEDFSQTEDEEVRSLLKKARGFISH